MRQKAHRGFTLMELLVVIAIIGMVSTVVLASLKTARLKAADANVRQHMVELRTIMELERNESGNYSAIKNGGGGTGPGGFISSTDSCSGFSGDYAVRAAEICDKLVAASATAGGCGTACVYFLSVNIGGFASNPSDRYSIEAYLPATSVDAGAARYYCMGSSGKGGVSAGSPWSENGCYRNP